jgi:hypothetical protein
MSRGWPAASTPNLEDQVIFDEGFLPLALDTPVSDCRAAVLVLVCPGIRGLMGGKGTSGRRLE